MLWRFSELVPFTDSSHYTYCAHYWRAGGLERDDKLAKILLALIQCGSHRFVALVSSIIVPLWRSFMAISVVIIILFS